MSYFLEEGHKIGIKLGRKYEKRLFPYYRYYTIHGCRKAISLRLNKLSEIREEKKILEMIEEKKKNRDRSKQLIIDNNFKSYAKRRSQEINVIYEELMIEILKETKKNKCDRDFWEGVKCGILISFGIMKR